MLIPSNRPPTTPGELLKDYLESKGLTSESFASLSGVTCPEIEAIILGCEGVSVEMALRFAHALDTTSQFWINAQNTSDMYWAVNNTGLSYR